MKKVIKRLLYRSVLLELYIKFLRRLVNILIPVIPQHAHLPFEQELNAALITIKGRNVSKQYENAQDLLVNLGAGSHGKPGWINVDISKSTDINCIYDCRKNLPFPDNSVKGIFTEHFFEHIDYVEEG